MAPKHKNSIDRHVKKRNSAIVNIERISQYIETNGHMLKETELQCRLVLVETYFQQIAANQAEIEEFEYDPETVNAVEVRSNYEDVYCKVKSSILTLCNENRTTVKPDIKPTSGLSENLPKLKLPQFSGKYSEYPNFKRLFSTLVDNEKRLTCIEKYNHLLSCLSGAALRLVKALDVSEDNYETALKLLDDMFNKKQLIYEEHIKALFNLPKIQRGSAEQLRHLVDTVSGHFNALSALYNFEEIANSIIVHIAMASLDNESLSKVQESIDFSGQFNWTHCAASIDKRCEMLESRNTKPQTHDQSQSRGKNVHSVSLAASGYRCPICHQSDHQIWKCQQFISLRPLQRYEAVKANQLCINCLSPNHSVKQCKATKCKHCNSNHHSLLHRDPNVNSASIKQLRNTQQHNFQPNSSSSQQLEVVNNNGSSTLLVSQQPKVSTEVIQHMDNSNNNILATAVVYITDKFGVKHCARALLDSASQLNFITNNLAHKLHLDRVKSTTIIGGIAEANTSAKYSATADISSCISSFNKILQVFILPTITENQPSHKINIESFLF